MADAQDSNTDATQETSFDDTDVPEALKRETADGSGFENEDQLPAADFESFAEDGVENDHDGDNTVDDKETAQ